MTHSAQKFCEHISSILSLKKNLEHGFHNFLISVPKYVFWGLGTFWGVQKIIDLFTIVLIFYNFGLIRDKS